MEFIKGYENLYKINREGQIYSCGKGLTMKQQSSEDGYIYVKLKSFDEEGNKIYNKCYIHRLLANQYHPNPDNKPEVDHIDRNKQNNSLDNLRWVTRIENRHNRPDFLENYTEEQLKERQDKINEYKRNWAEKDRRGKGMKTRAEMNLTKQADYKAKKQREYRAKMTPEEKEAYLAKRRAERKPLSEEQKEAARERARKQRLEKKNKAIVHDV